MALDTDPGIGIGTPIPGGGVVPGDVSMALCEALPLWRYAEKIQYDECQFFGVRNDATFEENACRDIWTELQREDIHFYLLEAQQEIEDELGFFLCPKWVYPNIQDVPDGDERYTDSGDLMSPYETRWGMVLAGGTMGTTIIKTGTSVSHAADPATVVVATTVTDPDEIWVFHPNSGERIYPSSITISGGNATILIPRCRMVKESLMSNPLTGLDYTVLTNFESTVDVYRIYNDTSSNAVLVTPHTCSSSCQIAGCSEYTQTACIYVRKQRIGSISLAPATYSGGTWSVNGTQCRYPSLVRLYYQSGVRKLTRQMEDAIMRLAHSKMPNEPCGCEVTHHLWRRDREIPTAMTEYRANNPFGQSNGAWAAWQFVRTYKLTKMSVI